MKKTGIWIDKEKAFLFSLTENEDHLETVFSDVENYKAVGGSRSKTRWGPQDVVQDSKFTEREKHQLKSYFKEIASHLKDADEIAIYGPADTRLKLDEELKSNFKPIGDKVTLVQRSDSMTENQMKAMIRTYFG